jgi:hypothetical protein
MRYRCPDVEQNQADLLRRHATSARNDGSIDQPNLIEETEDVAM